MAARHRAARILLSDIENDPTVKAAVSSRLPANYDFEVPKTLWRIRSTNSKRVALQFPEGFLVFATAIADLLEQFTGADVVILGDVVYGACCVDDFTARALGCDLLVHYGHSCLVTIERTRQPAMPRQKPLEVENAAKTVEFLYVFVTIKVDVSDLIDKIRSNFERNEQLSLCGTIQFANVLPQVKQVLETEHAFEHVTIPQCSPLSRGEVLGCTAPKLPESETLVFVADGRFHIEAVMLSNPRVAAFRYDPFARVLVRERYDFDDMSDLRLAAVNRAVSLVSANRNGETKGRFGVVLSTLGRQGAPHVLRHIDQKVRACGCEPVLVLLSEIFPEKLKLFEQVHCWVQLACPRLSIDWGAAFNPPLLNSYELNVALNELEWRTDGYPMDFYANDSSGPWTVNHESHRAALAASTSRKPRRAVRMAVEKASEVGKSATQCCSDAKDSSCACRNQTD